MDLPGRPGGNPDGIRAAAQSWATLASSITDIDSGLCSLVQWHTADCNWKGPAASQFADFWGRYEAAIPRIADQCNEVSRQLHTIAGELASAQSKYDDMAAAIAATAAVGIGLTFFTFGISDGVAAATDAAEVGAIGTLVADIAATISSVADALSGIVSAIAEFATSLLPDFIVGSETFGTVTSAVSTAIEGLMESPEIVWLRSTGWMPTLARSILVNGAFQFGSGMGFTLIKNIGDPGNIVHAEEQWWNANAQNAVVQSVAWGGVMFGAEFGGPVLAKALFDDPALQKLHNFITVKGLTEFGIGSAGGALASGLVIPAAEGQGIGNPINYLSGGVFGGFVGEVTDSLKGLGVQSVGYLRSKASDLLDAYGINYAGIQIVKDSATSALSSALHAVGQHPLVTMMAVTGTSAVIFDFVEVQGKVYMLGQVTPYQMQIPNLSVERRAA